MKQSFLDNGPDIKKIDAEVNELSHVVSSNYKPTEIEEYMSPLQIAYFKLKLLRMKSEILSKSNTDQEDYIIEKNRKQLKSINSALGRIESGEYGYCYSTWDEIGIERLEANPVALYCIEYQELLDKGMFKEAEEE